MNNLNYKIYKLIFLGSVFLFSVFIPDKLLSYPGNNHYNLAPPAMLSTVTVFTWLDFNEDGVKQPSESVVGGINLSLYNQHNNLIATGTTGQNGIYVFSNIPNGTYRVKFSRFSGLIFTFQNIGSDDNLDSDIDINGYSDFITIDHISDSYYFTGGYRGNLQVFLGNNKSVCSGTEVFLDALTYFGKSPFSYQWDNGLGQNPSISVIPDTTTTYHVTVTDAWGFAATNEITIKVKNGVGEEKFTVIDGFSSGSGGNNLYLQVSPFDPGPKFQSDYSDTDLISNYRSISLLYISGPHSSALELDYANSYFSHSNDVGTISTSTLCYNKNGAGIDFNVSEYDYFKIKDIVIDQGVLYVEMTMTDINGNSNSITKKLPGLGSSVIFDKEVFISEFNSNNIDLSHIAEFCMSFSSKDISIDFRMGDIWLCQFTDCPIKTIPNIVEMCIGDSVDISAEVTCADMITYEWDHNLGLGKTHKVSPQQTTTYTVTAIDAYGCSSSDTVRVIVHPKPSVILINQVELCLGDSIDITAEGTGGEPPYSFVWNTGDTTATIKVSPTSNTFYTVTISDSNKCSSAEKTIDVIVNPTPAVTATSTIANCAESDGSATASASDGTPPYTFYWNTGNTGANLQNIPAGLYYVTVIDANGCRDSTRISVEEKDCGLIGNFVWEDMNANGIQDINEPPISNLRTVLFDNNNNPIDTAYTDQNGFYYYHSLHQGQFFVRFDKPQDFIPTQKNTGDDVFDSDADIVTGMSDLIILDKYEKDSTIDAGFYRYASIGDTIWVDNNGDNIQNPGENGIEGFKVKLEDCNGQILDSMLTDSEGKFNFENLKPGQYRLIFILPDTMKFVDANIGADDSKDSDADPTTGVTQCEELESGEKNTYYDAGVYVPAAIGDYVWEDMNANGIQDENEPGIPNVSVILNDCQGNPLDTNLTDANGYYLFDDLTPGNYKISLIVPNAYYLSNPDMTNDDKDSDIQNDGFTVCEFLESGEKNHSYDIGLYKFARIGDKVWEDTNANGIQENEESGVEGVTVELRSCNGVFLDSTITDISGNYLFDDLMPGSYKIKFILPNDFYFSPANSSTDDIDSDPNIISGLTICEELLSGEENLTYDAGIYKLAKIGDKVWTDENGDGIQDNNEPGFENVEVVLQDCAGNDISNQFTDPNGNYLFIDLVPGDYRLKFIPPQDYSFTQKDAGEDDLDSDVDPITNLTICETLESGEDNRTYDGGLLYYGSLGDYVWEDINGDGIQQASEPPIENVELQLFFWENNQFVFKSNTFTDNNGFYLFNNLAPGEYFIKLIPPSGYDITLADKEFDDSVDSDFDDFNGPNTTVVINLNPGEDDMTWDAGLFRCATIGDLLWRDHIRDDVYNVGEAGINGETVNLWRNEGGNWVLWDQIVTSYKPESTCGDGYWSFCTNPGEYFIEFSGLANTNMVHVVPNVGNNEDIDSDIDDSNGINTSPVFVLSSGDFIDNLDGGYYPNYTLSGTAWKDGNTNGIFDQGEEAFAGINVELHDNTGIIASQVTNIDGEYSFSNLNEDQYFLWFELPANYVFTTPNVGNDDSDSDVTDDNGANTTDWIDLENDSLQNIDAGYIFQPQKSMIWNGIGGINENDHNTIWWNTKNDESIEYYKIFKGIDEEEINEIINTINSSKSSSSSYKIKDYDIQRIGTYKYKIAGIASDKSSIYSNEILIDVEAKTGMSIYPNPVIDNLNFEFIANENDIISYYIMDLNGKMYLKRENINIGLNEKYTDQINLNIIADGIYQLLIKTKQNSYILKFAKISS